MPDETPLLVFVSCPPAVASALAGALVERRLAACVSELPGMRSVYRWKDAVECSEESLLLIKTSAARYAELQAAVLGGHPYELPEIIALNIVDGLPAYLAWLTESVH